MRIVTRRSVELSPDELVRLQERRPISRKRMAIALGVTYRAFRSWEGGERHVPFERYCQWISLLNGQNILQRVDHLSAWDVRLSD
jgi:hypothetical protein